MNITLIGYRGAGKSTVARLVAQRLGWVSIDADEWLEQQAGRTVAEIFESDGEPGFRELEARVIAELTARDRTVIAAGGGAVLRVENRRSIKRSGITVWLVASPDTIARRIAADPSSAGRRPALTGNTDPLDEIRRLIAIREPWYRECADMIIDTELLSADQVADQIVRAIPAWRSATPME